MNIANEGEIEIEVSLPCNRADGEELQTYESW